ncbi:class I SAM-dependent methyltransferase [Pseudorhodoplanes sp.]|uniref:class I SAM-dependent methyltransferase n=1 Tax=Pseudorhodoplanes sp. TaxID=1934341 RepID=UPI002C786213|nr:class I SAM-dependent methyltransferase [Pseudorhodoplanes sp.]HWV54448.1 class I SAM-dependent methyltransferase [Pseudorhodoplanes sp.]
MNRTANPINVDEKVARGFGDEWSTFRQGEDDLTPEQRQSIFENYFAVFPWGSLPKDGGVGIDVGCGSGRWSMGVAPRVSHLHALDASADALAVARQNLAPFRNVTFHHASVGNIPLPDRSLDFAFSLGVLHHVPDTQAAINAIAAKLKPGAPFLIYLYYAFDNRPAWFRGVWAISDVVRKVVSRMPHAARFAISQAIAAFVYWPLTRLALIAERLGKNPNAIPLSWYRDKSFYVMRTDAYDRFCTRLEQRFTRVQISNMLTKAGFHDIAFSEREPFWCAVGLKK